MLSGEAPNNTVVAIGKNGIMNCHLNTNSLLNFKFITKWNFFVNDK
jgi:hypothetical protein